MKLRFDKQTLRLRLSESDLDQIKHTGFVEAQVQFPGNALTYRLQIDPVSEQTTCSYDKNLILVTIPHHLALAWMESEEEGTYASVPTSGQAEPLRIMVEKDFPCKHL